LEGVQGYEKHEMVVTINGRVNTRLQTMDDYIIQENVVFREYSWQLSEASAPLRVIGGDSHLCNTFARHHALMSLRH